MKLFKGRPSAGLIVACVALVLAITGVAVAGGGKVLLAGGGKTKVGAKQLKPIKQRTNETTIANGTYGRATATCKKKEKMTGGGATWADSEDEIDFTDLHDNGPASKSSWTARGFNGAGVDRTLIAHALCLKK